MDLHDTGHRTPDTGRSLRLARLAMRTRFELLIADQGDPARLRAAGEEALEEIADAEERLSAFRDGAALRRINQQAAQEPVRVDPVMLRFLRACQDLAAATDGACDLAIGALLDAWRLQHDDGGDHPAPDAAAIAQALAAGDVRRQLLVDEAAGTVRLAHPRARLDPGAVGKGWALDRAVALLRGHGVGAALLHGGTSTACGLGDGPGHAGWTIAVRHPRDPAAVVAKACLRDAALSVSAPHGRTVSAGGRTVGHVLDPRNGRPVASQLLAAVIHPSAFVSDALSTALLVLGLEGLARLPARFPGAGWLLLRQAGDGVERHVAGDGFG